MKRGLGLALLAALLAGPGLVGLAGAAQVPTTSTRATPPLAWAEADDAALEEVLRDSAVVTTPRQPGLPRYVHDLSTALGLSIAGWLSQALPGFASWVGSFAKLAVWLLLALVSGLAGLVVARWLAARRAQAAPGRPAAALTLPARPTAVEPDWRDELERRLQSGTARDALEALWHWLARRLVAGSVEASWTSRELVRRAGRTDLLPAVRQLDRLLYGAAPPGEDEVRRLWRDLRETA